LKKKDNNEKKTKKKKWKPMKKMPIKQNKKMEELHQIIVFKLVSSAQAT